MLDIAYLALLLACVSLCVGVIGFLSRPAMHLPASAPAPASAPVAGTHSEETGR